MSETFGSYELLELLTDQIPAIDSWIARSIETGETCILTRPVVADDELCAAFVDAVKEWPPFTDPALPVLIEQGKVGDIPFAAYEHFAGISLRTFVREATDAGREVPPAIAMELGRLVATAVENVHLETAAKFNAPAPVRTIEPSIVWISPLGTVHLFGFQFIQISNRISALSTGIMRGKFSFMSPEQVLGKFIDHRSDLFGLGSLIYWILVGRAPFDPDPPTSDLAILDNIRRVNYAPVTTFAPSIPKAIDMVFALCFAEDPNDRYSSARALAEALDRIGDQLQAVERHDLAGYVQSSSAWMNEVERLDRLGVEGDEYHPAAIHRRPDKSNMVLISGDGFESYYLDAHPVTCGEYARFILATDRIPPSHWPDGQLPKGRALAPMTHVRYSEALDYATWAHKRLPTEEEWERAATGEHGLSAIGSLWEWTSSWHPTEPAKIVRGGPWRDLGGPGHPSHKSYEIDRANDVGFRCALDGRNRRR